MMFPARRHGMRPATRSRVIAKPDLNLADAQPIVAAYHHTTLSRRSAPQTNILARRDPPYGWRPSVDLLECPP